MTRYFFILPFLLVLGGCASIQAPQGGPKDETPPILVQSNPENGQIRFSEKYIQLIFNENVAENNPKLALLSPYLTSTSKPGNKRLRIQPDSGWSPNTTYTLRLAGKIKDEREGIALKDTQIVFSTGAYLDTIKLSITVLNLNKKIADGKWLGLLRDSAKNLYFAQIEGNKPLVINGLHSGMYELKVFSDLNENYQYNDDEGLLVFQNLSIDSSLHISVQPLPHSSKKIKTSKQRRGDTLHLEGNAPFWLPTDLEKLIVYKAPKRDRYILFPFQKSIITEIRDSLGTCLPDTFDIKTIDSTRSVEIPENPILYSIIPEKKSLKIQIDYPWKLFRKPDLVEFTFDSVWQKGSLEFLENKHLITVPALLSGKLKIRYDTLQFYHQKGTRKDSIAISQSDLTPWGEISGLVADTGHQPIVVELLNAKKEWVAKSIGKKFNFKTKPGQYYLQCFVDWNGDGKYTGGNIKELRTSEPLYRNPELIELKPGWDIEKIQIQPDF